MNKQEKSLLRAWEDDANRAYKRYLDLRNWLDYKYPDISKEYDAHRMKKIMEGE